MTNTTMGLDIYFRSRNKVAYAEKADRLKALIEEENDLYRKHGSLTEEEDARIEAIDQEIEEIYKACEIGEVAYFRKVNFLMAFFQFYENNDEIEISKGQIETLLDYCKEVLEDHSQAELLLPTTEGFFWGTYDYDDWYFEDVEEVKNVFEEVLETFDFETHELLMNANW